MTVKTIANPVRCDDRSWQPWRPTKNEAWNLARVVHLHRRAGFGGTWKEIERDLNEGPDAAVQRFLDGTAYQTGVPADFQTRADSIATGAVGSNKANQLQAWWLYRMIYSPDPLGERLALMWHHHFATSNAKVRNLGTMHRQNQLFRDYGRANFGDLFTRVIRDPAILIYLDADLNQAAHPNENLAREMMELFSMGVGNFSESDVHSAARSLTGWTIKNERFHFDPAMHDDSEKILLGERGNYRGEDAVRIVLAHPATARRIAWRVCQMLMGENVVDEVSLSELADQFRANDMNISWLLKTVLRSNMFFGSANIGNRVRSAVEYVVGSIRSTGSLVPPPSTFVLTHWTARMGQRLFYPPNVFGFPENRSWLSSQWLIARTRFIYQLLEGKLHRRPYDLETSLRESIGTDANISDVRFLSSLLLGGQEEALPKTIDATGSKKQILAKILTSPQAHLG